MRANTFVGQVIAVLSRRASAFELDSAEPQTFPGRLRALLSRLRRIDPASLTPTGAGQVTASEKSRAEAPEAAKPQVGRRTAPPGQQTSRTRESFDFALALALDGVLADLDGALHDFTTANLRDVDLTRVQLEGLRWSAATQWPTDWVAQIALDSVDVAPDVFEVRGGNAYAPTPLL